MVVAEAAPNSPPVAAGAVVSGFLAPNKLLPAVVVLLSAVAGVAAGAAAPNRLLVVVLGAAAGVLEPAALPNRPPVDAGCVLGVLPKRLEVELG